jgi:methylated-DNA-[protein]-cysteine S-methyltransferase
MEAEIFKLVLLIPRGRVSTYKEIAKALKIHPRAVARVLSKNPMPILIPCHRVIKSDGEVGGYGLGIERKVELLKKEGIEVRNKRINLSKYLFTFD